MKLSITLCAIIALFFPLLLGATLPTCYDTYEQVTAKLFAFQQSHPDIAKVFMIGHSQQDNIPIYALKISDNVELDEEEPAILFVGQVHAEEVLGVQITLSNIAEILNGRFQMPYAQWINQLDIWFVPTANPEGHNVVTSNMDVTYRKNKRDNNLNGLFDYIASDMGDDIDGVDFNRNFHYNWVHGDTLLQPGGDEVYDYYRGPYPLSESENVAIKNLADQKKFVYSICWHSSRTGNFSEKLYYSFNWKEVRPSPDLSFVASIANGVGSRIIKEDGTGSYEVYPNTSRRGAFHDWMYQQYGTIQLLIECGTSNLQPDSLLMLNTIERCSVGVRWLLNRSLLFYPDVASSSMLTGKVTDAVTGNPLEAEIIIAQHHAPWFNPRTSKPGNGRYFRPLASGVYTLEAKKKGYFDTILTDVFVNNGNWTTRNITMNPKPAAILSGSVHSGGSPISARVIIGSYQPDTLYVNGDFVFNGYEGEYPIQIYADNHYPYIGTITLIEGQNQESYSLSPQTIVFEERWENGTGLWDKVGNWVLQNELSASGNAITDSWGARGLYPMNCDVWIQTAAPISIPAGTQPYLIFNSHLYTEWEFDPCRVQVSTNGTEWDTIWQKSGLWDFWRTEFVALNQYAGQSIYLRFRLTDSSTDIQLTDPGWTIDNIKIVTGTAVSNTDDLNPVLPVSALYPNYPNPFNPETTLSFSIAKNSPVNLKIYNMKGQLVRSLLNSNMTAGSHKLVWNGTDDNGKPVGSGLYFCRLNANGIQRSIKMVLIK